MQKPEQTEKSVSLLGSWTEGRAEGNPLPPQDRMERQARKYRGLPKLRFLSSNCTGNQCRGPYSRTITDQWLEAQCGQGWELKTPGDSVIEEGRSPQYVAIYLQELEEIPKGNTRENSPCVFSSRKRKVTLWSSPEHTVFLSQGLLAGGAS